MELAIYFESLGVLTVEQVPEYSFGDTVGKETSFDFQSHISCGERGFPSISTTLFFISLVIKYPLGATLNMYVCTHIQACKYSPMFFPHQTRTFSRVLNGMLWSLLSYSCNV